MEEEEEGPHAVRAAGAAAHKRKRKGGKKRKVGFHNVGKHGYGKSTAQKKADAHVLELNTRGFLAARHADRQGQAFEIRTKKQQNELWAIWEQERLLMMENLGLIKEHVAHFRDKKDPDYKKWFGILERYDFRTDVHVFMMNWVGFGHQGLCSTHQWFKTFYDEKDCSVEGTLWNKIFHETHPWFMPESLEGLPR